MSDKSKIEWTDASWNPIRARNLQTGKIGWYCEHATTGCEFCYAEGMNKRLGTGLAFKPGHRNDVEIFLDEKMLILPLRWERPRKIFVCSMTDLFADFVTDEMLDRVFRIIGACDDLRLHHTFQILTKRAKRAHDYLKSERAFKSWNAPRLATEAWPPRNVWLGVSAERQQEFDERWHYLRDTPAAVTFVSMEPLIGPILFRPARPDWIIVGGESGTRARPMHPQWARDLRDQCVAAGVAFFFKQWGEWLSGEANYGQFGKHSMNTYRRCDNHSYEWPPYRGAANFGTHPDPFSGALGARRVGKKAAGRLLDGREWNEMPTSPAKAEAEAV